MGLETSIFTHQRTKCTLSDHLAFFANWSPFWMLTDFIHKPHFDIISIHMYWLEKHWISPDSFI